MKFKTVLLAFLLVSVAACGDKKDEKKEENDQNKEETAAQQEEESKNQSALHDPHSFSNPLEVGTKHIHLDMNIDFDTKTIDGVAKLELIHHNNQGKFIFDGKGLKINKVLIDGTNEVEPKIVAQDELLGFGYEVPVNKESKFVEIHYTTTEHSEALQWLNPDQTAGKQHPYLLTQGQAILTRTWIPCQDSPLQRITYSAKVKCPKELMAVMSASNPVVKNDIGEYEFEMKQTIPSYLLALAVGDLQFAEIGPRTGVYSEPSKLKASKFEFGDMEKMLLAAEKLYGDYKWDRYDVIVLPPSFPYGGMENPRLTFATPTILAGDRSLVALIAHEMAHSWSGNLVTNATWDDFWLNEGFTVYFENRIMEAVYGKEFADMLLLISQQDLEGEIAGMIENDMAEDTHLKLDLDGRNPEDGLTAIAYDKGAFFLKMLEAKVGREKFDAFLKQYFEEHQFETMTTTKFLNYLDKELLASGDYDVNVDEWVYGVGLPESHITITSSKFENVEKEMTAFKAGEKDAKSIAHTAVEWSYQQTLHFVRQIDGEITKEQMTELDKAFGFTQEGNSEIKSAWLVKAIEHDYHAADEATEEFLMTVGRGKFLRPIYKAMKDKGDLAKAQQIYAKAKKNYHSVSVGWIDDILNSES